MVPGFSSLPPRLNARLTVPGFSSLPPRLNARWVQVFVMLCNATMGIVPRKDETESRAGIVRIAWNRRLKKVSMLIWGPLGGSGRV
jgi:hypothetical protein